MSSRPLWLEINGKREDVGTLYMSIEYGTRHLYTRPKRSINPFDMAIVMLADTLRCFGLHLEVLGEGHFRVNMPINDKYGRVCREIARAYFLALNSPNPRRSHDDS